MGPELKEHLLEELRKREYLQEQKGESILWYTPKKELARVLEDLVIERGLKGSVCTVFEFISGDTGSGTGILLSATL